MAEFRKYEEMKKSELIEMCELFGVEVHSKDTKQILIDKLNEKKAKDADARRLAEVSRNQKPAKASSGKKQTRKKRPTADERANAAKKQAIKEQTEEIMDSYADRSIDNLKPKVRKKTTTVHTNDGTDGTKNPYLEKINRELAASYVDPYHTLTGVMKGPKSTEVTYIDGEKVEYCNYTVKYGPYTILIPSFKFWDNWQDQSEHPAGRLYEQGVEMIGAKVDFNMFRKEETAATTQIYGTRLYASRVQRCESWYSKDLDGSWYIEEGDIVKAMILRKRPFELIIEYEGAEAHLNIKHLTHSYLSRIPDEKYMPGTSIMVKVSNIQRAEVPKGRALANFDYPVKFEASAKDAYKNPQIVYFDSYDVGDVKPAVISNIKYYDEEGKKGKVLYFCNIDDEITVAADLGEGVGRRHTPDIGSKVKLRITDKNREDHQFYGVIINVRDTDEEEEMFAILDI